MSRNINKAPSWCPNAVATEKGWVDPYTQELLISNRSLDLELIKLIKDKEIEVKEVKVDPEPYIDKLPVADKPELIVKSTDKRVPKNYTKPARASESKSKDVVKPKRKYTRRAKEDENTVAAKPKRKYTRRAKEDVKK